jgi:hypothetical protein
MFFKSLFHIIFFIKIRNKIKLLAEFEAFGSNALG